MARNPYSLVFGKKPLEMIPRIMQAEQIRTAFSDEPPSQQVFILTGVRGCGKTVLMTDVTEMLQKDDRWIVAPLNPERDMLLSLASKLASEHRLASIFRDSKINLSFFGFGLEVSGIAPITDIEVALSRMLESLKKKGKKVLITVDEAVNTKAMRVFAGAFQLLLRQDLPVYLLMTGLYENINLLQNEKTLTFLHRAPKIELTPLNLGAIADNYRSILKVDEQTAQEMAHLTKGYSFAFQVLGYFARENGGLTEQTRSQFRRYLEEYVYEKIWTELSAKDRLVVRAIAEADTGRILEIRSRLQMETNQFNPYRKRLIRRGIVNGDTYGYVYFTLPLFEEFVMEM